MAPRWKRGDASRSAAAIAAPIRRAASARFDWAVGELYAERYFPAETKARSRRSSPNMKAAFRDAARAARLDGPGDRREALKKLDTYTIKVGYPDSCARLFEPRHPPRRPGRQRPPRGRGRLGVLRRPQQRAGRQGRLGDDPADQRRLQRLAARHRLPRRDPAGADVRRRTPTRRINYGAIGGVIGHELTHGFDDQGRTIDASGALRDWWTPEDAAEFKRRADDARRAICAVRAGARRAHQARPDDGREYRRPRRADDGARRLSCLAARQAGAGARRVDRRPARVPRLGAGLGGQGHARGDPQPSPTSDPHSCRKYRVNGVVRNIDAWYAAFGVKPGDAMYVPPEKRARIW